MMTSSSLSPRASDLLGHLPLPEALCTILFGVDAEHRPLPRGLAERGTDGDARPPWDGTDTEARTDARRAISAARAVPGAGAGTALEAASGGRIAILESEDNKVTQDVFYRAVAVRCRCRMCPDCKKRWGREVRQRLLEKTALFKVPRLYTITVNREWHESPLAAYNYVMGKKFIARLLTKEFGIRAWVWVLEPQEASGGGWPHWHILMDVSPLPPRWYNAEVKESREERPADARGWVWIPHFFDLNRVHHLLRKWRIGEQCKLTVKRDAFDSAEHAVFYITKYLIVAPKRSYPRWMLKRPGLRFAQASRALGALVAVKPRKHKEPAAESEPRHRSKNRAPVDRIAECRLRITFLAYVPELDRIIGEKPFLGMKSMLETFAGAVSVLDFDFASKTFFTVWGFNDPAAMAQFCRLWQPGGEPHRELTLEIDRRRSELLGAWATGESQQQAA